MKKENSSILNWLGIDNSNNRFKEINDDSLKILIYQIRNTMNLAHLIQEEIELALDETTSYKTDRMIKKTSSLIDKYVKALAKASSPYSQEYFNRELDRYSIENSELEKRISVGLERENFDFKGQHRHSVVKLKELMNSLLYRISDRKLYYAQYNLDNALSKYLKTPSHELSPTFEDNLTAKHVKVFEGEHISLDI